MEQLTLELESILTSPDEVRQVSECHPQRRRHRAIRRAIAKLEERMPAQSFRTFHMRWIEGRSICVHKSSINRWRISSSYRRAAARKKEDVMTRSALSLSSDATMITLRLNGWVAAVIRCESPFQIMLARASPATQNVAQDIGSSSSSSFVLDVKDAIEDDGRGRRRGREVCAGKQQTYG
jgi:hypothetical protein